MKLRHALRGTAVGLLLAVCLTTPTLALTGVVDVGGSTLRVRKSASTTATVLDQLPHGKQVEIVDTATNGWYGIRLGSVVGLRFKRKAEFAGGGILILLGTKILLEHLGIL